MADGRDVGAGAWERSWQRAPGAREHGTNGTDETDVAPGEAGQLILIFHNYGHDGNGGTWTKAVHVENSLSYLDKIRCLAHEQEQEREQERGGGARGER
jgi:hypothetical protein